MENPSVGAKTMAEIPWMDPKPQLVEPFLAGEGATIIYGKGGTGKGLMAVWLAGQLVERGFHPGIIDFEGRRGEWTRRARNMGLTEAQLAQIVYIDPTDVDWHAARDNISAAAASIGEEFALFGVDYLIVDSYSAAAPIKEDSMGGQSGATAFYEALQTIGITNCLVLAHVAGNSERFPKKPLGTVGVVNFAREAWAIEKREEHQEWLDKETYQATHGYLPTYNFVELRCMKKNEGEMPDPVFFDFAFMPNGDIDANPVEPPAIRHDDRIAAILRLFKKPMEVKHISAAYLEEYGEKINPETVRTTMRRHQDRFTKVVKGDKTLWTTSEQTTE